MKKVFIKGVVIILIIVATSLLFLSFVKGKAIKCLACQRIVIENMTYRITPVAGKTKIFCCPRCALRYERTTDLKIRHSIATDYFTKEPIAAREAIYVEGSEVVSCCKPMSIRTENSCFYRTWDRCLPSLISFKTKIEAEKFQSKFGGKVLSYQELHQ